MEQIDIVRRDGNYVFVCDPAGRDFVTPPAAAAIVKAVFRYESKQMLPQMGSSRPEIVFMEHNLWDVDQCNRIILSLGFLGRLTETLEKEGFRVRYLDEGKTKREEKVFVPVFENAFNIVPELRHMQDELLVMVAAKENGRFNCPPGFGKSLLLALLCIVFPKARILIVSKRKAVLVDRIYPDVARLIPDVGVIGGGKKQRGFRVTCVTAGSLGHVLDEHWDMVLVDEAHEAAADDYASKLAQLLGRHRIYGFSGSFDDSRFDGKDIRCEALFGPVRLKVGYEEARGNAMVVPIRVVWTSIPKGDKGENKTGVARQRVALWRNMERNAQIVADARQYEGQQVIVSCGTIEHICAIKSLCPEAVLVYAMGGLEKEGTREERTLRQKYLDWGWIAEDEPVMSRERQSTLFKEMQKGKPGIFVCTGVINVGVDLKYATVVVRADAASSAIMSTQVPGRVSRVNDTDKSEGIVHDYLDEFSPTYTRAAKTRQGDYKKHGWKQQFPEPKNPYGRQLTFID